MNSEQKYYLVEAKALPEVFLKVAEVKRILETGELSKVSDAAKRVGISRSAFYKYKDSILPFQNLMSGRIITFQMLLRDTAGLLSRLLTVFASAGANILTINQTIPVGDIASVTISAETTGMENSVEALLDEIGKTDGVYKAEILAG
ncbi:MAG: ACT domain-containing protein [Oscillospiraceae bacterium]|nr:ACT domain-containing protein [Oscillospiraceae bacterium]